MLPPSGSPFCMDAERGSAPDEVSLGVTEGAAREDKKAHKCRNGAGSGSGAEA